MSLGVETVALRVTELLADLLSSNVYPSMEEDDAAGFLNHNKSLLSGQVISWNLLTFFHRSDPGRQCFLIFAFSVYLSASSSFQGFPSIVLPDSRSPTSQPISEDLRFSNVQSQYAVIIQSQAKVSLTSLHKSSLARNPNTYIYVINVIFRIMASQN